MKRYTLPLWSALLAAAVHAGEAVPVASDPALEARTLQIASELRCLVCQNQTIADSHSGLAIDLRQEIRTLLAQGQDEAAVRRFMTDRYGDFVLYKPPFKLKTGLLWLGPVAFLLLGLVAVFFVIRHKRTKTALEPTQAEKLAKVRSLLNQNGEDEVSEEGDLS